MIQAATIHFLQALKKNNDKTWFDAHRDAYETARADFEGFIGELLQELTPVEPGLAGQKAKDCIYRIYRDVRFSKDKTPYKPNFSAYFTKGGKKWEGAGFYLHLEPGAIFAGGGLWMPPAPLLKAVRQEIDYNFKEFEGILKSKSFKKNFPALSGERLQRAPQGYEESNPAIEYLKMKSFISSHSMSDEEFGKKGAVKNLAAVYTSLKPLIDFLNRAVEV